MFGIEMPEAGLTDEAEVKRNEVEPEQLLKKLNKYLGRDGQRQNLVTVTYITVHEHS